MFYNCQGMERSRVEGASVVILGCCIGPVFSWKQKFVLSMYFHENSVNELSEYHGCRDLFSHDSSIDYSIYQGFISVSIQI